MIALYRYITLVVGGDVFMLLASILHKVIKSWELEYCLS